jgi:hypothetical protein
LIAVLPVVETQLGDERDVEAVIVNPLTLQPTGNAGAMTPSNDSEYGNEVICARMVDVAISMTARTQQRIRKNMARTLPLVVYWRLNFP